ncbi:glycoside hydrolase family 13 protein [Allostreptomyces psammosilenae]|uniref:Oligo-1,6-glucosidase n=1 Tax=Allostreptomyces psammosilenae TaxID=1892865 RepID=A0A852ZRI4_9ACTN|nr:alpha-glucosidase [Allostreptomyces psammosilenae]NYI03474.1 oligo-1,6-glucosidase [Allostreptomyces psammosilenae]
MTVPQSSDWWKSAVVYQVYPRSFRDSDGDGIGDLPGVIEKLDYLKLLGVDVVWLSPVYPSPGDDNGYDISDYCGINPEFGTLADFERLRDGLHERGMRLVMDLVVNHTSDEHPWFRESRESVDSPKRDWYIWRPPAADGGPPNNWGSVFSGSAWEYDEKTGEYFLHLFSRRQPDLNWENPQVREAVHEVMRWWLDRGVDGFRMDVINFISKEPGLPSSPEIGADGYGSFFAHAVDGPMVHRYLREMNDAVLAGRDVMTVGEMPGVTLEQARLYTAPERREVNMVFQFEHVDLDDGPGGKFDPVPVPLPVLRASLNRWQQGLAEDGWNSLYWNNHDQPRVVSRFGDDSTETTRVASAKMLATVLHLMKGTPYIYQGEELGMTNAHFTSIDDYRDIEILNYYRTAVGGGLVTPEQALRGIRARGRDNARTPVQWNAGPGAGFTTGTPWIAVNDNYQHINAEAAIADDNSVFHHYRRLITLRKTHPVIVHGTFHPLLDDHDDIYAYLRTHDQHKLLVIANWTGRPIEVPLDPTPLIGPNHHLLISTHNDAPTFHHLRPYEARAYLAG